MIPQQEFIEHKIEGCTYRLLPGTPLPKPRKRFRRGSKPTKAELNAPCRSMRGNTVRYLQWAYPSDKTLQKIDSKLCDVRQVKDKDTGKTRWLNIIYDRSFLHNKYKSHLVEIPHWDFDDTAKEVTP